MKIWANSCWTVWGHGYSLNETIMSIHDLLTLSSRKQCLKCLIFSEAQWVGEPHEDDREHNKKKEKQRQERNQSDANYVESNRRTGLKR